ncbi:MAG: hypothetical protein ACO1Q7_05750 [Gemmatimonas sp.]
MAIEPEHFQDFKFVTVVLYASMPIPAHADNWRHIAQSAQQAFRWDPVRYVRAFGKIGARGISDQPLTEKVMQKVAINFASGGLAQVLLKQRSASEEASEPDPRNQSFLTIGHVPPTPMEPDVPIKLPFELSLTAQLDGRWPTPEERSHLMRLASAFGTVYGCVYVGRERDRATSERLLVVPYDWRAGQPAWAGEIHRMDRQRAAIGTLARDSYWGNFLADSLVSGCGGPAAFESVDAAVLESLGEGVSYLQLTPTISEALGEMGLERRDKLKTLLAPVTI